MTSPTTTEQHDALAGFRLDAVPTPGPDGAFGEYGGSYVPELLVAAAHRIAVAWDAARGESAFLDEYVRLCREFVGRPTPLQEAPRFAALAGGARVVLKREDLAHTGAHKINNALGQGLLARRLGARRVIAETGAGQHGVATATVCAMLGLPCEVFMGAHDVERQRPNVDRMRLLGATVHAVEEGARTLGDAVSAAIREWIVDPHGTYYLIGSAVGMHPFPTMVRDLQCVIGHELDVQANRALGCRPDAIVACVGGGSNSIGTFAPFVADPSVALHGAEAAGHGLEDGRHAASISAGRDGVLHGARTRVLQDDDGQILATSSISAGLDYPAVGPEHAQLAASRRVTYHPVTDEQAMGALRSLCRTEGIIPAIESAHALALGLDVARDLAPTQVVAITVSGRGDKDLATIQRFMDGDAS